MFLGPSKQPEEKPEEDILNLENFEIDDLTVIADELIPFKCKGKNITSFQLFNFIKVLYKEAQDLTDAIFAPRRLGLLEEMIDENGLRDECDEAEKKMRSRYEKAIFHLNKKK